MYRNISLFPRCWTRSSRYPLLRSIMKQSVTLHQVQYCNDVAICSSQASVESAQVLGGYRASPSIDGLVIDRLTVNDQDDFEVQREMGTS